MNPESTTPTRRVIAKGAAWTVPAVAVATSAPSLAASPNDCDEMAGTFNQATPGTYTVTIPECITQIEYAVRGGGGAGPGSSARGAGAEIRGSLSLIPGTGRTLTLIVADGGGVSSGGLAAGGSGFGRGGRGSNVSNSGGVTRSYAGGGGSAVRLGTTPLLVSGGGGGGCHAKVLNNVVGFETLTSTHSISGFTYGTRTAGGNRGNALGMGLRADGATAPAVLATEARAGNANGTGGRRGGQSRWITPANNNWSYVDKSEGANGGNFGTGFNGGGNGGDGAAPLPFGESGIPSAGGGGGGYAGGGGGGLTYVTFQEYAARNAAATSGAAGSSFVSSATTNGVSVLTSDVAEGTSTPRDNGSGHTGWIWLRWS